MNKECCKKCYDQHWSTGKYLRYLDCHCPCHSPSSQEKQECEHKCLTFIKNGFCLHTGYPPRQPSAPMESNWEVEFDDDFFHGTSPLSQTITREAREAIKSFIREVVAQAYRDGFTTSSQATVGDFQAGHAAALKEVVELIEQFAETHLKNRSHPPTCAVNTALSDLKQSITRLTENK